MMTKKIDEFLRRLREQLQLFLTICFGVFLFVLFFQPFDLEHFDFNNRLLLVAGLGVIVFLFLIFASLIFPRLLLGYSRGESSTPLTSFLRGIVFLALSATAFAFYLRYVGLVNITFYIMIKIILICMVPPIILRLHEAFKRLKLHAQNPEENKSPAEEEMETKVEETENQQEKLITLVSDNQSEELTLPDEDIVYIKSADNYVEVLYYKNKELKKELLRTTMKHMERQLKKFSNFMRCHRTFIINIRHVDKLTHINQNFHLILKNISEPVPVSRQYLLKVKTAFPA